MIKPIICLLTICCFFSSLWAFDLSGSLHLDTYSGEPSVGVSFSAQANISKAVAVRAQADYLTAKNYDIQSLVIGKVSKFIFGGGFALGVKNNTQSPVIPGIGLLIGLQATKGFCIEASSILTFTPADIGKIYDIRAKLNFLYKNDNTDSSISYTLKKGINVNEFINSFNLEVAAFESGIPIGLLIGSGIDLFTEDNNFGFDVQVMGGLSLITKKYGSYFIKAEVGVLSYKESIGVPYDIAVGAKFSF